MIVLFSDGQSHDHSYAVRVAREMKDNGVAILCVAIGKGQKLYTLFKKLKEISSKPEYTFKININAMNTIADSLVKEMCDAVSKCILKSVCFIAGTRSFIQPMQWQMSPLNSRIPGVQQTLSLCSVINRPVP